MSKLRLPVIAISLAAAITQQARAQDVAGALSVTSGANALMARFTTPTFRDGLGPADELSRATPPAYAVEQPLATYSRSVLVPPSLPPGIVFPVAARFSASLSGINSAITGSIGSNDLGSSGTSTIKSAVLTITGPLLLPTPRPLPPLLRVEADAVSARATFSKIFPNHTDVTGASHFKSLKITGRLVGDKPITLTGDVKPNTVLYQSASVTITANAQISDGSITCVVPTGCTLQSAEITVHGLVIDISKAAVDGRTFSGTIELANVSAH